MDNIQYKLKNLTQEEKNNLVNIMIQKKKQERLETRDEIKMDSIPVTFMQESMWIYQMIFPESTAYNVFTSAKIQGKLNTKIFCEAFSFVVKRHSIMRTFFKEQNGNLEQIVTDNVFSVEFLDLSGEEKNQEKVIDIKKDLGKAFDLSKMPLYRATLIKIENNSFYFLFNIHHIIYDNWSLSLLIKELLQNYSNILAGKTNQNILTYQYCNYALEERKFFTKETIKERITFWDKRLKFIKANQNQLPIDKNSNDFLKAGNAKRDSILIDQAVYRNFNKLQEENKTTVFILLLSIFAVLLHNYSKNREIYIAIPVTTRRNEKTNSLLGCFVDMLILNIKVEKEKSFGDLVKTVDKNLKESNYLYYLPSTIVNKYLRKTYGIDNDILYQVMFNYIDRLVLEEEEDYPDISIMPEMIANKDAKYAFSMEIMRDKLGLKVQIEYDGDCYDEGTIKHILFQYEKVFRLISENSNVSLSEIIKNINQESTQFANSNVNQYTYWSQFRERRFSNTMITPDFASNGENIQAYYTKRFPFINKNLNVNNEEIFFEKMLFGVVLLFYKLQYNENIVIFCPGLNQNKNKTEILPYYFKIDREWSCKDLKEECHTRILEVNKNQEISKGSLINAVGDKDGFEKIELALEFLPFHKNTSIKSDVILQFAEEKLQSQINLTICYNSKKYKRETIAQMSTYLVHMFGYYDSDIKIADTNLNVLDEMQNILKFSSGRIKEYNLKNDLAEYLEINRQKYKDKIAIIEDHREITYCDLYDLSDRIANSMFDFQIQNEFVAIMLERSVEFIASMFGIWKTGNAYMPLAPDLPVERIIQLLNTARVKAIITTDEYMQRILLPNENRLLYLNMIVILDCKSFVTYNKSKFRIVGLKEDSGGISYSKAIFKGYAYLIYTSGSTGTPKGVIIKHAGAINHVFAMLDALKLKKEIAFLQMADVMSDISIWQFVAPIIMGGKVVICDKYLQLSPLEFIKFINDNDITLVEIIPTSFNKLVEFIKTQSDYESLFTTLECVILTGEAANAKYINMWLDFFPKIKLANAYGPAEAADDVTLEIFEDKLFDNELNISVGKPLNNTNIYIVNKDNQLAAINVYGEIYIGGLGVGAGYINDISLTKRSFVSSNRLGLEKTDEKLYRTGDMGMWTKNGKIVFGRRIDNQIELNGNRVEIGEIESTIKLMSEIEECIVTQVYSKTLNRKVIVAFFTVFEYVSQENISDFIDKRLPQYMHPNYYIKLDHIPKLVNGKVDYKYLQEFEIDNNMKVKSGRNESPENETEKLLLDIFKKALGIKQVSIYDNIFVLGGDSITILQIVGAAQKSGMNISMKDVFERKTVHDLAQIPDLWVNSRTKEYIEIPSQIPLSSIQKWFFELKLKNRNEFTQRIILRLKISKDAFYYIVDSLCMKYPILKARFIMEKDTKKIHFIINKNIRNMAIWIETAENSDYDTESYILKNLYDVIDIFNGRLCVFAYIHSKDGIGKLVIIFHHLIIDGVSWKILFTEIQNLSIEEREETGNYVEEKYVDGLRWNVLTNKYTYYNIAKGEFDYCVKALKIRQDYICTKKNSFVLENTIVKEYDDDVLRELYKKVNQQSKVSLMQIVMASLLKAFLLQFNISTVQIDIESHGRNEFSDKENINLANEIGWFTAIFPVVFEIKRAFEYVDILYEVRSKLLEIPAGGSNYNILKYNNFQKNVSNTLNELDKGQIRFNYLGSFAYLQKNMKDTAKDQIVIENFEGNYSKNEESKYVLDIECYFIDKQLIVKYDFDNSILKQKIMEQFANLVGSCVKECIKQSVQNENNVLVPEDFTMGNLNRIELKQIVEKYKSIEDIYVLTSVQMSMLSYNILSRGEDSNVQILQTLIEGDFEFQKVNDCLERVFYINPILRTVFVWHGLRTPHQVVLRNTIVDCKYYNIMPLRPNEKEGFITDTIKKEKKKRFVLEQLPLIRFIIIQTDEHKYLFLCSYLKLLLDDWSCNLLVKEFFENYNKNSADTVNEKKLSNYINYITRVKEKEVQAFWNGEFHNYFHHINENNHITFWEQNNSLYLKGEEIRDLEEDDYSLLLKILSRNEYTLFTFLMACWSVGLACCYKVNDIIVGKIASGRINNEGVFDKIMGSLSNTIPMRLVIDEDMTVFQFLKYIMDKQMACSKYAFLSLRQISKYGNIDIQYLNDAIMMRTINFIGGGAAKIYEDEVDFSQLKFTDFNNNLDVGVPLRLYVINGKRLQIKIVYNQSLFDPQWAKKIINYVMVLIKEFIKSPSSTMRDWIGMLKEEK